jgi:hypothetical protein
MKGHEAMHVVVDEAEYFREKVLGDNVTHLVRVTLGNSHTLYTYRWTGSRPLRRGEKVIVPVSDPDPDSDVEALCTARVAAFGSSYEGPVKDIVRRQHPWEKDR